MKEKKITTKYVLNTKVKPEIGFNGEDAYPLYIQVIFNRSMTQFPAKELGQLEFNSPLSINHYDSFCKNESVTHKKKIEDIIRYESKIIGVENYSLKGLSKRISNYYDKRVTSILIDYLWNSMNESLKDKLTYRQYIEMESFALNNSDYNDLTHGDCLFSGFSNYILYYYFLENNLDSLKNPIGNNYKNLLDAMIHLEAYYWYYLINLSSEAIKYPAHFSYYDWIISKSSSTFLSYWMNQDNSYQSLEGKFNAAQSKFIKPIFKTGIKNSSDLQEVIEMHLLKSSFLKELKNELST